MKGVFKIVNNIEHIIGQYNIDKYGNPQSVHIIRKHQVSPVHNQIILDQIPDDYNNIEIVEPKNLYEVFNSDEISTNTYYRQGRKIYFDKSMAYKEVLIDYYGIGIEAINADSVYTLLDNNGNIIETIDDIITNSRHMFDIIEKAGGIVVLLKDLKDTELKIDSNETQRNKNEEIRIDNENKRIKDELKRVDNENTRQGNEDIRYSNENKRKDNEEARKTNENTRKANENKRDTSEIDRMANEDNRINRESIRDKNEKARENAEAQRNKNEEIRQENEDNRELNEGKRSDTFETLKNDINSTIFDMNNRFNETEVKATSLIKNMEDTINGTIVEELRSSNYKSYEGSNVLCENTFDGRTKDMKIKGRSYQNIISSFNKPVISSDGTSASIDLNTPLLIPNSVYTAYIIKQNNIENWYFSDSNNNKYFDNQESIIFTFTTPEVVSDLIKFNCIPLENTFQTNDLDNVRIILLKGKISLDEMPKEYFEGIKSVGDEDNKINIFSCSNLVDSMDLSFTTSINGTEKYSDFIDCYIPAKIDIQIALFNNREIITNTGNVNIIFYDKDKNLIDSHIQNLNPQYISTGISKDSYYIRIQNTKENTFNLKIDGVNISIGNNNIGLNSFGINKKEIALKDSLKGFYQGVYDSLENKNNTVYLVQRIGNTILNGSEEWQVYNANDNYICFKTNTELNDPNQLMCERFNYLNISSIECNYEGVWNDNSYLFIRINKGKLTTKDEKGFKEWLRLNETTIYYQLETPVLTELNINDINLETYESNSVMLSENNIKPILKFKVATTIKANMENNSLNINKLIYNNDKTIISSDKPNNINIGQVWIEIL